MFLQESGAGAGRAAWQVSSGWCTSRNTWAEHLEMPQTLPMASTAHDAARVWTSSRTAASHCPGPVLPSHPPLPRWCPGQVMEKALGWGGCVLGVEGAFSALGSALGLPDSLPDRHLQKTPKSPAASKTIPATQHPGWGEVPVSAPAPAGLPATVTVLNPRRLPDPEGPRRIPQQGGTGNAAGPVHANVPAGDFQHQAAIQRGGGRNQAASHLCDSLFPP